MSTYPLTEVAEFLTYGGNGPIGLRLNCPNCGIPHAAWFRNPIVPGDVTMEGRPMWDRTGETLADISLTPSFLATGCYHSWIRNGMLCVDSPFSCKRKDTMTEIKKSPPPKPPAPPSGGARVAPGKADSVQPKPPAATPTPAVKLTQPEQLLAWSKELSSIGGLVPTKNVVDSDVHGKRIQEIAAGLKAMAEGK